MKRSLLAALIAVGVCACSFSIASVPDTWTENVYGVSAMTEYTIGMEDAVSHTLGFTNNNTSAVTWERYVSVGNWFRVTGDDPNPGPTWRMMFSALCNNSWNVTDHFVHTLQPGYTATMYHKYYERTGLNMFTRDQSPFDTASRSLEERVTLDLWYEVTGPTEDPPGGGGDN
jgi:hypothetical protein